MRSSDQPAAAGSSRKLGSARTTPRARLRAGSGPWRNRPATARNGVSTASDGEAGLRDIFASRPDALVLDLMLPGRTGLEVLRELREEPLTRSLPVVVLTARGAEMDKLIGFEHGADDYLTKPF